MTEFDYTGQTVLVTGGMRGIGRAISEAFLRAGAQVWVCGRTAPADSGELPRAGREAHFIAADIRDMEQVEAMLARIAQAARRWTWSFTTPAVRRSRWSPMLRPGCSIP